jgi:hypothetical protein
VFFPVSTDIKLPKKDLMKKKYFYVQKKPRNSPQTRTITKEIPIINRRDKVRPSIKASWWKKVPTKPS